MSDNIYMWKHKKRVNHLTLYQRWGALIRFLTSPACSFVQRSKVSNNGNSTDAIHAYTCNTSCIDSCQILTCKISRPQSMYGLCVRVKPFCGVIESMLCSVYWRYTNLNQTWKSQDFKNEYSFHRHLLERSGGFMQAHTSLLLIIPNYYQQTFAFLKYLRSATNTTKVASNQVFLPFLVIPCSAQLQARVGLVPSSLLSLWRPP